MSNSPINQEALTTLLDAVGGDPDFLQELLDEFFQDAPAQFQTLHSALAAQQADVFRRAAHTMKSNCNNFGALSLGQTFKTLEEIGKSGDLEEAEPLLAEAEAAYPEVKAALESAVNDIT